MAKHISIFPTEPRFSVMQTGETALILQRRTDMQCNSFTNQWFTTLINATGMGGGWMSATPRVAQRCRSCIPQTFNCHGQTSVNEHD
jgi:hypothetical protein